MEAKSYKERLQKKLEQCPEKTRKLFKSLKEKDKISSLDEEILSRLDIKRIHDGLVETAIEWFDSMNCSRDPEDNFNPYAEALALDRARKEGIDPFEEVERLDKIAKQIVKRLEEKGYNCGKQDNPQPDGTIRDSNVYDQGADFIMRIALPSSKPMEVLEKLDSFERMGLPFAATKKAVTQILNELRKQGKTEEEITNTLVNGALDTEIKTRVKKIKEWEALSEESVEPMVKKEIEKLYKKEWDEWQVWGHDLDELCLMIIDRSIDEFNYYNRSALKVARRLINAVRELKMKGYDIHFIKEAIQRNPEKPQKEAIYHPKEDRKQ